MYGIDKETQADSSFSNIQPGIHENIELSAIAFEAVDKEKTGKKVLTFTFKDGGGATIRHIVWPLDPKKIRESANKNGKDPEESVKNEGKWLAQFVKHIMTKFISEEAAVIANVPSYEAFADAVITKLAGKTAGRKMRLKVVGGGKYPSLPKFPNFIGAMEEPNNLVIGPKDKMALKTADTERDAVGTGVSKDEDTF